MEDRKTVQELLTPAIKTRKIYTFPDFIKIVRDTWKLAHPKGASIIHAFPVQDEESLNSIKLPVVAYRLISKVPCQMGEELEIKPRIRNVRADLNNPQQTITTFAQRFTHIISFGFWAASWDEAEELEELFEDFMLTYTGVFKELGVSEMIYQEASEDVVRTSVTRADLVSSHAYYKVDIEKTVEVFNQVVESIKVKLKTGGENSNG